MDESDQSDKEQDPDTGWSAQRSQTESSGSENDRKITTACPRLHSELLLEDYNTSDDEVHMDHHKAQSNTKNNISDGQQSSPGDQSKTSPSPDNQSKSTTSSCDQNLKTTVNQSSSSFDENDQNINNESELNEDKNNVLESGNAIVSETRTPSSSSKTVIELTPLEFFSSEDDAVVTSSNNGVKENEKVQVKVVKETDKSANKENIILVRRTARNGEISSQTQIDNLSKRRSGTPFVQCGSVNPNVIVNSVTRSSDMDDVESSKDSVKLHRSDSKKSSSNLKKVPISSRVELMLSTDLFKKYVGKHQGLLERISQRQGRGRQSGLKKTFSNLDLSNLDLEQEFNSPFAPSFDKQLDLKDDKVCANMTKSSSFSSGDQKEKDQKQSERRTRRLSLAGDKDLEEIKNELDRQEKMAIEAHEENNLSGSNRRFKFMIPSFEDFKRTRKDKLIRSQKFLKDVLHNDSQTKAAVSLSENKIQSITEIRDSEEECPKKDVALNEISEDEKPSVLPFETMPFEVHDLEALESGDEVEINDKIKNVEKGNQEISINQSECTSNQSETECENSAIPGPSGNSEPEPVMSFSEVSLTPEQNSSLCQNDEELSNTSDVSEFHGVENKNNLVCQTCDKSRESDSVPQHSLIPQNSSKSPRKLPPMPNSLPPKIVTQKSKLPVKIQSSNKSSQNVNSQNVTISSQIDDSNSANLTQSKDSENKPKERVILRASRKRKISARKSENLDLKNDKTLKQKISFSVSSDGGSPSQVNQSSREKCKPKIPLLSFSSLSSDGDVFPEKSPALAGTFIFKDDFDSLSPFQSETDKSNSNSVSDVDQSMSEKGDNSDRLEHLSASNSLTDLENSFMESGSVLNKSESQKKLEQLDISNHDLFDDDPDNMFKNSVMRSISDVTDSTPDAHRKRRERRERPYKSDPFAGRGPKLPATRLLNVTGKQRSSSSLKEDFLDFTDDTSLEEVNEEEDSYISEYGSENGTKMRNRLSNLSNASSDSGVNGLPDTSCDLVFSPNNSETSLYNLFNSPDNVRDEGMVVGDSGKFTVPQIQTDSLVRECSVCRSLFTSCNVKQPSNNWVCLKCSGKFSQRKEAITEIRDTEISYGRDLKILKEEFYKPMRAAGLLSADQLESIFLNLEELIAVNKQFTEKLANAFIVSEENGDQDLLMVNIGHLFMESTSLILAFDNYCVNQGHAAILLEQLEREKEILRIFLRVSQDENSLLRRMPLKSFLMVPVQRITRYPLLLERIHKLTPDGHMDKDTIVEAKAKIEEILGHINAKTKQGLSTKMKRKNAESLRISLAEKHEVNKVAIDILGWNKKEVCDIITSRLLVASQSDQTWAAKKMKSIKFTQVHGVLLALGQGELQQRSDDRLLFPKKSDVIQAAVILIKEKNGRYQAYREPFMLNRCVVNENPGVLDAFELMELSKEPFLFRGEDTRDTKLWLLNVKQQTLDLGSWRRRRNALPNIMMKHII